MDDIQELVTVASYLTRDEADSVKSMLSSREIEFIATGHDAGSRYRSLYYEIKVKNEDKEIAKRIIDEKKARIFIENRRCPKCKNLGYKEIEKKGFWEKIYYMGTTLVQCKKCKARFPI